MCRSSIAQALAMVVAFGSSSGCGELVRSPMDGGSSQTPSLDAPTAPDVAADGVDAGVVVDEKGLTCVPASKQCLGSGAQTCQIDGTWGAAVACMNQVCVSGLCTGVCSPGAVKCNGLQPQTCGANGAWQNSGAACGWPTSRCDGGVCVAPPSCVGLAATCGSAGSESCCTANAIIGGTYNRSNDPTYPATVSNFRLDDYHITVGRFRKFIAAYSQTMTPGGAGKNPNDPSDPGWDVAWNANLAASAAALTTAVKCDSIWQTWTDTPGDNENRPMNCIDWYETYAFCIWDAGRLPTEAEWNYAAAGGSEQRPYPWGAAAPDCTYANYDKGMEFCTPGFGATNNVGSESPKGDGRWGQSDLAGNVFGWALDGYGQYANPCINCSNLPMPTSQLVLRGGGFNGPADNLLSSNRFLKNPSNRSNSFGGRCARSP